MELSKSSTRPKAMVTLLIVSISLLLLLALSLSACQEAQPSNSPINAFDDSMSPRVDRLPHLLGVVKIPVGHGLTAQGVIHPDGLAYILNNSGSIAVLDGPHLIELITWPVDERGRLEAIALHPYTHQIYVADHRNQSIQVISSTHVAEIISDVGYRPKLIVVQPDNGLVYVANVLRGEGIGKSSNVAIITGTQVITWVHIEQLPQALISNPVDHLVYVGYTADGEQTNNFLTVISGTKVITATSLGVDITRGGIYDMAVNPQNGEMYMVQGLGTLIYYSNQVVKTIHVGEQGYRLNQVAVEPKRGWAYATSWEGPPSHVLVVQKDQIVASIPVGFDPRDVVVDQTHDYVYVANRLSSTMSVIRGTEVITTLDTMGQGPTFITVDEQRGYIYVSNSDSPSIAVFGFEDAANKP